MQMNAGAGVGSQASMWTVTQVWGQTLCGISKVVTWVTGQQWRWTGKPRVWLKWHSGTREDVCGHVALPAAWDILSPACTTHPSLLCLSFPGQVCQTPRGPSSGFYQSLSTQGWSSWKRVLPSCICCPQKAGQESCLQELCHLDSQCHISATGLMASVDNLNSFPSQ